jgi:uncharacterized protein
MKKLKLAILAAAMATSSIGWAQDGKAALVKQFVDLNKPGIEAIARLLVEQSSAPIAQAGSGYLQTSVPKDKQEAAAKAADAVLKKYFDDNYPYVRDKALQLAPTALGDLMTQNFSEDELKQINAWLSSPVAKKYAEIDSKLRNALAEKVIAETRTTIEPKISVLDADVARALGAPMDGAKPAGAAPAKAPAKK